MKPAISTMCELCILLFLVRIKYQHACLSLQLGEDAIRETQLSCIEPMNIRFETVLVYHRL